MTKEEQKASISALVEEQRGYMIRSTRAAEDARAAESAGDVIAAADAKDRAAAMKVRLAEVDAELKRLGYQAEKPSDRAQRRPRQRRAARR